MKKKLKPVQSKFKWNKSSLIETDLYIRIYLAALNNSMTTEDKQTLFLISKFFTDGAAEVGRGNFAIADYYFKRGEAYYNSIPQEKEILRRMLNNVYHRSKSFYYYRQGHKDTAIEMIYTTLENNKVLEKNGFEFLVFDRVQQYYNLARVYFSKKDMDNAINVLSGSICFLIQHRSLQLPDLNENYLNDLTPDIKRMRYLLLCQMLFDTTEQLFRDMDGESFLHHSQKFFIPILEAALSMQILLPEDNCLKKWILTLSDFYQGKYKSFDIKAEKYVSTEPKFYNERPQLLLQKFIDFAHTTGKLTSSKKKVV